MAWRFRSKTVAFRGGSLTTSVDGRPAIFQVSMFFSIVNMSIGWVRHDCDCKNCAHPIISSRDAPEESIRLTTESCLERNDRETEPVSYSVTSQKASHTA